MLNREGFRKILKKHDKAKKDIDDSRSLLQHRYFILQEWRTSTGLTFHLSVIMNSYFVTSVEIDNLILQVEVKSCLFDALRLLLSEHLDGVY